MLLPLHYFISEFTNQPSVKIISCAPHLINIIAWVWLNPTKLVWYIFSYPTVITCANLFYFPRQCSDFFHRTFGKNLLSLKMTFSFPTLLFGRIEPLVIHTQSTYYQSCYSWLKKNWRCWFKFNDFITYWLLDTNTFNFTTIYYCLQMNR